MKPLQNSKADRRHVDFQDVKLSPRIFTIQLPDKDINVGNALFLIDKRGGAILWHIFIKPEYRRQGFASNLLKAAQQVFVEIITDWETEGGYELCRKAGFVKRKNVDDLRLIWRKDSK